MKNQPPWIIEDLEPQDIDAINQGGCESGTYMPAVTYWQALDTMTKHGDDVFNYIEDHTGEIPVPQDITSWSALAVYYLSYAVELYAAQFE